MTRRTTLKWLHWLSSAKIFRFFLVEPDDVERLGGAALATHAGMGTLLAILLAGWLTMYVRRGLASRPGTKLPGWARSLTAVVLSGALAGFAAPFAIHLFGVIPFFPGIGTQQVHALVEEIHEVAFDALMIALAIHMAFHLWRHYMLKDNALRIMAPKALHRYL